MNKFLLVILFSLKILVGLYLVNSYGTRYENRQDADIYKYHHDGMKLHDLYKEDKSVFFKVFYTGEPPVNLPETSAYYQMQNWATMDEGYRDYISYQTNYTFFHPQRVLIRFCTVISFISTNIYFQSFIFSLLGGLGLVLLIHSFFPTPNNRIRTINIITILLFLIPTSLLWTSTILKESIIILSIGMSVYGSYKWYKSSKKWNIWISITLIGLFLLLVTSLHHFLSLFATSIVALSLTYLSTLPKRTRQISWIIAPIVAFTLVMTITPKLVSKYNYEEKIGRGGAYIKTIHASDSYYIPPNTFKTYINSKNISPKLHDILLIKKRIQVYPYINGYIEKESILLPVNEYMLLLNYEPANSYIEAELKETPLGIISHLPIAFRNVFLAPLFTPSISTQGTWILFALENSVLLLLILFATYHYIKNYHTLSPTTKIILYSLLTYATIQFILIGYTSPILGNIVRYKTVMVLSLVMACFLAVKRESFSQRL